MVFQSVLERPGRTWATLEVGVACQSGEGQKGWMDYGAKWAIGSWGYWRRSRKGIVAEEHFERYGPHEN